MVSRGIGRRPAGRVRGGAADGGLSTGDRFSGGRRGPGRVGGGGLGSGRDGRWGHGTAIGRRAPDIHHGDPLAHLQVSIAGLERIYATLSDLADETASGRWLVIAGGGYNPMTLGRIWALQLGALAGIDVPDALPTPWRDAVRVALDDEPPLTLRQDERPQVDAARREAADREALATVRAAQALGRFGRGGDEAGFRT